MNQLDLIHKAITARANTYIALSEDGLFLQFKQPDTVAEQPRVFVYRVGRMATDAEIAKVGNHLKALLLASTTFTEKTYKYQAGDGLWRMGKLILWTAEYKQTELVGSPAPAQLGAFEVEL